MDTSWIAEGANKYLQTLCNEIPNRSVGSHGNRLATRFFAETIRSFGFEVDCPEFDCMDCQNDGAMVSVHGKSHNAQVSPYSLGVKVTAPLMIVSSAAELEALETRFSSSAYFSRVFRQEVGINPSDYQRSMR